MVGVLGGSMRVAITFYCEAHGGRRTLPIGLTYACTIRVRDRIDNLIHDDGYGGHWSMRFDWDKELNNDFNGKHFATASYLVPEKAPSLSVGSIFRLHEGKHVIGHGIVIEDNR